MVTRTLDKGSLFNKRWPNFRVAEEWLARHHFNLDSMKCMLVMAFDEGGVQVVQRDDRSVVGLSIRSRIDRDNEIVTKADFFTTVRFQGRGSLDRREFQTLREAVDDVGNDARALVYAVYATADMSLPPHDIPRFLVMRGEAPMVSQPIAGTVYQKLNGDLVQVTLSRKDSPICVYMPLDRGQGRRKPRRCDAREELACPFSGPLPRRYARRLKVTMPEVTN